MKTRQKSTGSRMHEHGLFVSNVFAHLVALMSGIASFGFAVYETVKNKPIRSRVFWAIGTLCLLIAFDQAWRDEHHNAEQTAAARERDTSELGGCKGDLKAAMTRADVFERQAGSQQANLNAVVAAFSSQQAAVNNCVVALVKTGTPPRLRITVDRFALNFASQKQPTWRAAALIARTNRAIPSASLELVCTQEVDVWDLQVRVGGGPMSLRSAPQPPQSKGTHVRLDLQGITWQPEDLLFMVVTGDKLNEGECSLRSF